MRTGELMRLIVSAMAVSVLHAGSATAQSPGDTQTWLDEIAMIEAQTQLLQKREELKAQLERLSSSTVAALPSVVAIVSLNGRSQAQLYFPSGRLSYVSVGELVAPNVRVAAISGTSVEVRVEVSGSQRTVPLSFMPLSGRTADPLADETNRQRKAIQDAILPDRPEVNMHAGDRSDRGGRAEPRVD